MVMARIYCSVEFKGQALPSTLPKIGFLSIVVGKRRISLDGHVLQVEESRSGAQMPLHLLAFLAYVNTSIEIWLEQSNVPGGLGLEQSNVPCELRQYLRRNIVSNAIILSRWARHGFQMSIRVEIMEEEAIDSVPATLDMRNEDTERVRDLEDDEYCPICLDEFGGTTASMVTSCSHVFHSTCILTWLERRNSCPLCRCPLV